MTCGNWSCEREIAFDWPCCPHCGAKQPGVPDGRDGLECIHTFVIEGPRCILCGYDPEIGSPSDRAVAIGLTVLWVVLALALAGHAAYLTFDMPVPATVEARRVGSVFSVYFVVAAILLYFAISRLFRVLRR